MNLRNGKVKPDYIDLDEYESESDYESPVKRSPYNTRYQTVKVKTEPNVFYEAEAGLSAQPMFNDRSVQMRQLSAVPKHVNYRPEFGRDIKPKVEPIDPDLPDASIIENQVKKIKTEVIEEEFMKYYRESPRRSQTPRRNQMVNQRLMPGLQKPTYECYLCGKTFPHLCRVKVI